jgi:hypothetical protein
LYGVQNEKCAKTYATINIVFNEIFATEPYF